MKYNKNTLISASLLLLFCIGSLSTALGFDPTDYDTYEEGYNDSIMVGIEDGFFHDEYGYSLGENIDELATQEYKDGYAEGYDEWYWNYHQFSIYINEPEHCDEYEEGQRDAILHAERDQLYDSPPSSSLPAEDLEDWATQDYVDAYIYFYFLTYWSIEDPALYDFGVMEGEYDSFWAGHDDATLGLPNDVISHFITVEEVPIYYQEHYEVLEPFVAGYNEGIQSEYDYGYEIGSMVVVTVPTISLEVIEISLNSGGDYGYLVEFKVSLSDELPEGYVLTTEIADLTFDGIGFFTAIVFNEGEILSNIYLDGEVEESESLTFSIDTLGLVLDELDALSETEIYRRYQRAFDNKMRVLTNLVLNGDYNCAYSKLLHDIKPKLTKTDPCGRAYAGGRRHRRSYGRRAWTTPSIELEQQIDAILWALSEIISK